MKKRKTRAQRSRSFRCPHCGAAMILRPASEIYHDAKSDRKLYVCHNYPACNTYVAAHPNTDKPMGVPANGNLRNLRIQAHRKFDLIYGDIFLYGNWSKERDDPFKSRARVYVLKTLKQDKESYLAVGMLVNLICYYANEFVATHLDRFD